MTQASADRAVSSPTKAHGAAIGVRRSGMQAHTENGSPVVRANGLSADIEHDLRMLGQGSRRRWPASSTRLDGLGSTALAK